MRLRGCRMMQRRRGSLAPVDMPLGERVEQYILAVTLGSQSLEYSYGSPTMTVPAADLLALGSGLATIAVQQVGDWGASRPAATQITLN
jgi:hypothetical protein